MPAKVIELPERPDRGDLNCSQLIAGTLDCSQLDVVRWPSEEFDTQQLATDAMHELEAYQRAPWRQINERAKRAHLVKAIQLLERIRDLESGKIPMPMWGD